MDFITLTRNTKKDQQNKTIHRFAEIGLFGIFGLGYIYMDTTMANQFSLRARIGNLSLLLMGVESKTDDPN